jgi:hypothetical protein
LGFIKLGYIWGKVRGYPLCLLSSFSSLPETDSVFLI